MIGAVAEGTHASMEERVRQIRAAYPELAIHDVRRIEAGQYSDVLVVNGALIFRFPRFDEGVAALRRELAILEGIRSFVTLPVPEPIYQSLETDTAGEAFMGYRMLPGEPLWREAFTGTDARTRERLARQLAGFLRELHGVPVAEAITSPLPAPDYYFYWSTLYHDFQEKLYVHMRPDARRDVSRHFEHYLTDRRNFAFSPVLAHGDFGTGNILFDAERGEVTGIVDFGSAGLHDPALDYAALLIYGEPFLRHVIAAEPEVEAMLGRIRFYNGTFALMEALYGVEKGDRGAFERGIAQYR